jgi:aryl-alcohol dehydrogenase-like predicted oxidoreductase
MSLRRRDVLAIGALAGAGLGKAAPRGELRTLGKTGIKVCPLGFGASRTMEQALLKTALDAGANFFDTGRSYFNGQNEVMIGGVIQGIRKNVVVQSKVRLSRRGGDDAPASSEALHRVSEIMSTSLAQSLKALKSDYIDILLLHGVASPDVLRHEEVQAFLEKAKKSGQIRACGFSAHSNQAELVKTAVESGLYDVAMIAYNHRGAYDHSKSGRHGEWDQAALNRELEKARKAGLGIVAMKTCSGGTYAPSGEAKPSLRAAIRWVLQQGYVQVAAVAMGNMEEVKDNLQVLRES